MPGTYSIVAVVIEVIWIPAILTVCVYPAVMGHLAITLKVVPLTVWSYYPFITGLSSITLRVSPVCPVIVPRTVDALWLVSWIIGIVIMAITVEVVLVPAAIMQSRVFPAVMGHLAVFIKVVPLAIWSHYPFSVGLRAIAFGIWPGIAIVMPSIYSIMAITVEVVLVPAAIMQSRVFPAVMGHLAVFIKVVPLAIWSHYPFSVGLRAIAFGIWPGIAIVMPGVITIWCSI